LLNCFSKSITQTPTLIARAEQVADNCDDVDALIELLHGRTGHP